MVTDIISASNYRTGIITIRFSGMEKKVFFKDSKGYKLCGIINNPTGLDTRPIVVLAHGFSSSKQSSTYLNLSENLARHGISTFRFDFFGHGESQGKFQDITITEAVDDIIQAIKFVKSLGYRKIGLFGSSFGGNASIIAASKTPKLFALALKSPVSSYLDKGVSGKNESDIADWRSKGYTYYISGDGKKSKLNYSFVKDFKNADGYKYAPEIKAPTLIVHGDADETVPYEQSVKISKLIPNCRLHTVKGANHHYDDPKDFQEVQSEVTKFIVELAG